MPSSDVCTCAGSEALHPIWPPSDWCDDCLDWARAEVAPFVEKVQAPGPASVYDAAKAAHDFGLPIQVGTLWFALRRCGVLEMSPWAEEVGYGV